MAGEADVEEMGISAIMVFLMEATGARIEVLEVEEVAEAEEEAAEADEQTEDMEDRRLPGKETPFESPRQAQSGMVQDNRHY